MEHGVFTVPYCGKMQNSDVHMISASLAAEYIVADHGLYVDIDAIEKL